MSRKFESFRLSGSFNGLIRVCGCIFFNSKTFLVPDFNPGPLEYSNLVTFLMDALDLLRKKGKKGVMTLWQNARSVFEKNVYKLTSLKVSFASIAILLKNDRNFIAKVLHYQKKGLFYSDVAKANLLMITNSRCSALFDNACCETQTWVTI